MGFIRGTLGYNLYIVGFVQQVPVSHNIHHPTHPPLTEWIYEARNLKFQNRCLQQRSTSIRAKTRRMERLLSQLVLQELWSRGAERNFLFIFGRRKLPFFYDLLRIDTVCLNDLICLQIVVLLKTTTNTIIKNDKQVNKNIQTILQE